MAIAVALLDELFELLPGEPQRTIALQIAEVFDEILLSTDSEEIAEVGKKYGAVIPGLRPAHLATDTSDQFDTHAYIFDLLEMDDETHHVCVLNNNPFIPGGNT